MSEVIKTSRIPTVANVTSLNLIGIASDGSLGRAPGTRVLAYMGEATDADNCTSLGIWNLQSTSSNIPSGTFRNVLVCLPYTLNNTGGATCTQILFTHTAGREKIYRRTQLDDEWSSWKEVSLITP